MLGELLTFDEHFPPNIEIGHQPRARVNLQSNFQAVVMLPSKKQACSLKRQEYDIDATLMKH